MACTRRHHYGERGGPPEIGGGRGSVDDGADAGQRRRWRKLSLILFVLNPLQNVSRARRTDALSLRLKLQGVSHSRSHSVAEEEPREVTHRARACLPAACAPRSSGGCSRSRARAAMPSARVATSRGL